MAYANDIIVSLFHARQSTIPNPRMPPRRVNLTDVGHQNIVYSEAEQIVIKNTLKTTKAGLLRLGTLRSNSATGRRQLKDQIRRCKVALAPSKKIPKEIWLHIFELYCQSGRLSTRNTKQSPVVLMQVCSAWRQIVLSIPKLWSDVHMGGGFNLAKMWLERAGNIPRGLETTRDPSHCFDNNRARIIQDFICSFPFKKLRLTDCDAVDIDFTGIPVESLLPLEDLALLKVTLDSRTLSFSPHHFPNLVSLHIEAITMPRFHVSRPFATWKKLRVLRLESKLDNALCLEILRDASSVEYCSLNLMAAYYNYGQDYTIQSAVVANLKALTLTCSFTPQLLSLLDHLTLPNLHTLILIAETGFKFQSWDIPPLLCRVERIGSLRFLNILHLKVNVDVGLILERLPLLQVLEAQCTQVTTHTAEKIGRGDLGGCLRELHDWSYNNLYEFLRACELRRDIAQGQCPNSSGGIASLEKVSVRRSMGTGDVYKRRISKLRKDGVEFKVF